MTQAKRFPTLPQVVGINVRRIRDEESLSADELARALREVGLTWYRSTVAELERGRRGLSLDEFLLLVAALGCTVDELLRGGHVSIGEDAAVELSDVRSVLGGDPFPAHLLDSPDQRDRKKRAVSLSRAAANEAEQKAARRLGSIIGQPVSPRIVARAAHDKWGRSLTEERDARVGEDASPQHRGHVTRELVTEIEKSVRRRIAR